ncbi:MAG: DHH family phosphoesterase [Planctomycetota bacterium]|jgi:phosphoesterase RecJ-like protein|nr:DHH family phosphoesterase [Planctomycetota bacterium]
MGTLFVKTLRESTGMGMRDILDFIEPRRDARIAVVSHQRPDGDAAGSAWGMAWILRALGADARPVNISPVPPNLGFLVDPEIDAVHPDEAWPTLFDAMIVLDCGEWQRLDARSLVAEGKLPTANIDHHATSSGVGEARWIEADASSTSEMIVRLADAAGWPVSPSAALALWIGIVTDTGRFSYENSTAAALEAAAACVRNGADPAAAATRIYQSSTRSELALRLRVMEHMEFQQNGRLATSWLSRSDFAESGVGVEGVQDLINIIRDVDGVEAAALFYETPARDGVKVSLRTRAPHDATALATIHGGGGHRRAAGCTVNGALDDVRHTVTGKMTQLWFAPSQYTGRGPKL